MDAKEKKYWIIGILLFIAIVVFVIWRKKNQEQQKAQDVSSNEAEPVKITEDKKVVPVSTFPLKMGSRGPEVFKLQAWMLRNEGSRAKVDGIWGKETEEAVKKYLKVNSISQEKYKSMGL